MELCWIKSWVIYLTGVHRGPKSVIVVVSLNQTEFLLARPRVKIITRLGTGFLLLLTPGVGHCLVVDTIKCSGECDFMTPV